MINTSNMNPFQEMKFFYTHIGRGFKYVKWRRIVSGAVAAYVSSLIIFMLAFRLLDGVWDWRPNLIRSTIVAGLIGLNMALQAAMRRGAVTMQEELLAMQVKERQEAKEQ